MSLEEITTRGLMCIIQLEDTLMLCLHNDNINACVSQHVVDLSMFNVSVETLCNGVVPTCVTSL
jgi:hypothetical protein